MDQENELSGQQSLLIIQQMIETAKKEQKDDGKSWIIWGWMLFAASALTALNLRFQWGVPFIFWNIFGLLSVLFALISMIRFVFFKKRVKVKTYTKDLYNKLNTGFYLSLIFIIVGMNAGVDPIRGFPLLMNLYAFWVLIYGAVLNFRPSIIGAFIIWTLAFGCFFIRTLEGIMVLHGAAAFFGYIVPGHIANREFKKLKGRNAKLV